MINHNTLGWLGTGLSFVLNFMVGDNINKVMTIIVSALSIIYLYLKIEEKFHARKERRNAERKEHKKE